jgi:D-alanyl-D-alanine carboxypeptidase
MATTSQLRSWWAPYRCNTTNMVRVAFPGNGRQWNLQVADRSAPLWEQFATLMTKHNYLFLESAGGSYNCRKINTPAGTSTLWSLHSYGIAVDLNPSKNPYKTPLTNNYPPAFIKDVEAIRTNGKQAFQWGGRWSLPDAMHWQINVAPGDIPEGDNDMAALQIIDLQKACNKAGLLGANGKPLVEDDIYGANTEFALVNGLKPGSGGLTAAQLAAAINTHASNPDAHHD